ncbi:MAG TPA: hypothetical protein VM120_26095 [Bryobacteraceae bacterium]|nr:hypothetical protein [Bryobacteraceae bacterium]
MTTVSNGINSAQVVWASSGYGFSTTGSFTDLSTAQVGFGPHSYSNIVFDASGMAGTLASGFRYPLGQRRGSVVHVTAVTTVQVGGAGTPTRGSLCDARGGESPGTITITAPVPSVT